MAERYLMMGNVFRRKGRGCKGLKINGRKSVKTQEVKMSSGKWIIESKAGRAFEKSCLCFQYQFYLRCSGMAFVNMLLKTSRCGCSTTSLGRTRSGWINVLKGFFQSLFWMPNSLEHLHVWTVLPLLGSVLIKRDWGKNKIKPSFSVPLLAIGISSVCCSQRKSCMRQYFVSPAKKRALPSLGLSTCAEKEGSPGPWINEKASFLAGFISHLRGVGETNCHVEKGRGIGAPIFTYRRRAPVFACARCVTGISWHLGPAATSLQPPAPWDPAFKTHLQ